MQHNIEGEFNIDNNTKEYTKNEIRTMCADKGYSEVRYSGRQRKFFIDGVNKDKGMSKKQIVVLKSRKK